MLDVDTKKAYKVKFNQGVSLQSVDAAQAVAVEEASDVTYEEIPYVKREEPAPVEGQGLGRCENKGDGSYYRNYVKAGILEYSTDIVLPTQVKVSVPRAGAFVYTGFTADYKKTKPRLEIQQESGFQWVNSIDFGESKNWNFYMKVAGAPDAKVTHGKWSGMWKFDKYNLDKGSEVNLRSRIYNSDGKTYIVTNLVSGSKRLTAGIRNTGNIDYFRGLKPSNQDNIWARKIVSVAYRKPRKNQKDDVRWPGHDRNSYVKYAEFKNSKYIRNGQEHIWKYNGCSFERDDFKVKLDSPERDGGEEASVYRP